MPQVLVIVVFSVVIVGGAAYGLWRLFKARKAVSAGIVEVAQAVADKRAETERAMDKIQRTVKETQKGVKDAFKG